MRGKRDESNLKSSRSVVTISDKIKLCDTGNFAAFYSSLPLFCFISSTFLCLPNISRPTLPDFLFALLLLLFQCSSDFLAEERKKTRIDFNLNKVFCRINSNKKTKQNLSTKERVRNEK